MTDLLLHNDDVVHAVLDFIDNFDLEIGLPALPLAQSPLPSSPSPSQTAKRPRMHSGQRVRTEIQRLRASVVEMEALVLQLQQRRVGDSTPTRGKDTASTKRSWEDIAQRQKAQCQHAQRENARLRAMVVHHARIARKLETVVTRSRRVEKNKRIKRELIVPVERANEPWTAGCDRLEVRTVS